MADEFNVNAYDTSKIVNKIYLGKDGGTTNCILDMTKSGNTPAEKASGHDITKHDGAYILSNIVKKAEGQDTDNEFWGVDGKLVAGTCELNANVTEDHISSEYVVKTLKDGTATSFHVGGPAEQTTVYTGNINENRGIDGSTTAGAKMTVTPFQKWAAGSSCEWITLETEADTDGFIRSYGDSPSSTQGIIDQGVIGDVVETTAGTNYTKIRIDMGATETEGETWLDYVSDQVWIFGRRGNLSHSMMDVKTATPYLNEQTVLPDQGYVAMKSVIVSDTPVDYKEETTGAGYYTCYIGEYHS